MYNHNNIISERQQKTIYEFVDRLDYYLEKYDYIVVTTRRCFCFIQSLILCREVSEKVKNLADEKIVSSQSVDIRGQLFRGKRILICDDIMIHGQSVLSLYNNINKYEPESINILVMLRNIEKPDYFKYKTLIDYDVVDMVSDESWRHYSNAIVKFIHSYSVLYISYVYGFRISKDDLNTVLEKNKELFCKLSVDTETYKESNYPIDCEPVYYLINDVKRAYNVNSGVDCIRHAILRVYHDPLESDSYWVVPYAEIKDIYVDGLEKLWNGLPMRDKLIAINSSCDRYKALTAMFSIVLFKKLFEGVCIQKKTTYIDKSYFDGFLSQITEVDDLLFELATEHLTICEEEAAIDNIDSSMMNAWQNMPEVSKIPNSLVAMKSYFALVSEMEETAFKNLAKELTEEKDCIINSNLFEVSRINTLKNKFGYYMNQLDYVKFILYFMDTGVVSAIPKFFLQNGREVVGLFVKAGEQSFHLYADIAKNYFKSIYYISNYLKIIKDKKKFIDELLEVLDKKLKNKNELYAFDFILRNNIKIENLQKFYFGGNTTASSEENEFFIEICDIIDAIT